MFYLYLLCKSLIKYAYYIYGYQPVIAASKPHATSIKEKKTVPTLEEIEEGSEEDDIRTPGRLSKSMNDITENEN
jgi:hypothetical protein